MRIRSCNPHPFKERQQETDRANCPDSSVIDNDDDNDFIMIYMDDRYSTLNWMIDLFPRPDPVLSVFFPPASKAAVATAATNHLWMRAKQSKCMERLSDSRGGIES